MKNRSIALALIAFALLSASAGALNICDEKSLHTKGNPCFVDAAQETPQQNAVKPGEPTLSDAASLIDLVQGIAATTGYNLERRALAASCRDRTMLATLEKHMQRNGLYNRGFTRSMVVGLMSAESNCNQGAANGQGIMQVVRCAADRCGLDENIRRGTAELAGNYDRMYALSNNKQVAIALVFFAYNRGEATAKLAAQNYKKGKPLRSAMAEACYYYFDKGAYGGCGGFGREACCNTRGLGSGYPARIAASVITARNGGIDSVVV